MKTVHSQSDEKKGAWSAGRVTNTALGIAIVCITTRVFQFPIPLGYAHLGNAAILLFSVFGDPVSSAIAAGAGSALADLLSFPEWALPTLLIKALMGGCCSCIAHGGTATAAKSPLRLLSASAAAVGIMVTGYTAAGAVLYGSLAVGLTQIPGLLAEGIVGILLFFALIGALKKVRFERFIGQ